MNMKNALNASIRWGAAAIAVLVLSACSTLTTYKTPQEAVEARSTARWNYLVAGDYPKAYGYLPPSDRAVFSEKSYVEPLTKRDAINWESAKFISVNCSDESRCVATFEIGLKVFMPGFAGKSIQSQVTETWVNEDGQWWYYRNR